MFINSRLLRVAQYFDRSPTSASLMFANHKQQLASIRLIDYSICYYAKRIVDIVLILLSAVFVLPLLLLTALLIKLDSSGPIFFIQERVGSKRVVKNGTVEWVICKFPMFKFRSMVQDADDSLHKEIVKSYVAGETPPEHKKDGASFKIADDPRITRIGHILRKSSIDELPQLLNVLRGEMSLVGPRPVPEYETELYGSGDFERLTILPGMTGLWQISGRGDLAFEEMMALDIEYTRNWSFWLDLKILLETVPSVILGRGAK